jgi:hypothetical protein
MINFLFLAMVVFGLFKLRHIYLNGGINCAEFVIVRPRARVAQVGTFHLPNERNILIKSLDALWED